MNIEKLNKILHKGNKKVGLGVVITALIMIVSLSLGAIANPILLIEYVTIVPLIGEWGTALLWIGVIAWAGLYYFDMGHELLTNRRKTAFLLFAVSLFMVILTLVVIFGPDGNHVVGGYISIVDYYEKYANFWTGKFNNWTSVQGIEILNVGFILPLVLWLQSLLGMFEPLGLFIWFPLVLYFLYVILMDDWQIYLAKLNPFGNKEEEKVKSHKKAESIDLNEATEEFNLNFSEEEKKKIEIIEKVRTNMDKSSYDELSNKIKLEREKLSSLREKVISKVREQNDNVRASSEMPEALREKLQGTLGYTTYSLLRKKAEEAKVETEALKSELNSSAPAEESKETNLTLINEGYQTTEQVLDSEEPLLADDYVNTLLDNYDPTMEVPLIEDYYNDIFNNEEATIEEILKTLEIEIEVEEETTSEQEIKEVSGEIVIDQLEEELSVEEYLSLPEEIEKSVEKAMDLQQVHAIADQKDDTTTEDEFENYADSTESTAEISVELEDVDVEEEEESTERPKDWCTPYVLPSTSILSSGSSSFDNSALVEEATNKSKKINEVLQSFNIKANVNSFEIGPTVSTFKLELTPGVKTTKVTGLEDNFKLAIGAEYIRILAPIPGTSFIGIEVPNSTKKPVPFKDVYNETKDSGEGIQISIGQDVSGNPMSFDLTKAPHLLVAGSTGSGKSVAINTILASILLRYKPTDVQLVLVDPKMVEFAPFHGVPHLLAEVIIDASNANKALQAMVQEMEDRYMLMAKKGAKKLEELNEILISEGEAKKPYIVIIIDELADLMMVAAKEVEDSIMRITQKARAAGIHMVLATQRPSTEIITGTIKSNIPSRMAFTVASSIDSRTILGQVGAEKLIGMGDMLVSLYGKLPTRGQGAYISNSEVEDITAFTKSQCSAHYIVDVEKFSASKDIGGALIDTSDPIYIAAKDTVIHYQKASTSMLQRHLSVGYNKAANIIETLEMEGIIGPARGSKPREVLIQQ